MKFSDTLPNSQETVRAGISYRAPEMSARYVDTYREEIRAGSAVPPHSHSFYELLFCRSVSNGSYMVEGAVLQLKKGDILFLPPNVSHQPILPDHIEDPFVRDILWISRDFMEEIREKFMPGAGDLHPGLLRVDGAVLIGELFRKGVLESEAREPGWEAAVAANTISILVALHRAAARPVKKAETADLPGQILTYVDLHLSEKISLANVAGHFFISQSTISQAFRKKLGVSFYRCVTLRRIACAKALIDQGAPLETVAEQVGFTDYSAFFRAFKQEEGISPKAYQKAARSDSDQ